MPESAATQTAADMTYAKPHEFLPTGGSNRRAARMQAAALRWLLEGLNPEQPKAVQKWLPHKSENTEHP